MPLTMTVVSFFYNERLWYRAGLAGVSVLSRLGLLFLLCRSDWDEQRFILKVMNKFLFVAMLGWLILVAFFLSLHLTISAECGIFGFSLGTPVCCPCSRLHSWGIRGTSKLPFGLKILQIFFSRGQQYMDCAGAVCTIKPSHIPYLWRVFWRSWHLRKWLMSLWQVSPVGFSQDVQKQDLMVDNALHSIASEDLLWMLVRTPGFPELSAEIVNSYETEVRLWPQMERNKDKITF